MQPATATAPTQPMAATPKQPPQFQQFCALSTPVRRQCPNNDILHVHPEWSDLEEENDISKQEKEDKPGKEEEEEWHGTRQEQKEQELKSNKSDLETMSSLEKEDTPQLTDSLIGTLPILPPGDEQMDK